MYLNKEKIKKKINKENLIEDYIHLDTQLGEKNFDLTVSEIKEIKEKGKVDFSNDERHIPDTNSLQPRKKNPEDDYGWWILPPGNYVGRTNETINIPEKTVVIQQPRLTLTKSGIDMSTRLYTGKDKIQPEFHFSVTNKEGFEVKENARVLEIYFLKGQEKKFGGLE